jgi:small subunit ribosomal protein S20
VAHHASALKQMRQSLKHKARNRQNIAKLKTQVKSLRAALAKGDGAEAQKLLPATVGEIDKAAKKGVVHDNAAARYKSRLTRRVNALTAGKGAAAH